MLTIHWLWLPLIITLALYLIAGILNGFELEPQNDIAFIVMMMCSIVAIISFWIYLIVGIIWLFNHINIIS